MPGAIQRMDFVKAFVRQPRRWIFVEMALLLLLISALDYATGYELRLLPFYAGPIFVIAWCCGYRLGVVAGLIGGFASLTADWLNHDPDLGGWTEGWEITRHLVSTLAVALVGVALRAKSDIAAARIALLERAQRLEHEIVNISEAEQRRLGQDLHDGLCQYLAALSCSATSLRDDLRKAHRDAEAKSAGELATLLQDAVVQTRDLARGLAPAQVGRVGCVLALESLAQSVTRLQGISCTFTQKGPAPECDEHLATHLYRIAQEAINNATRHGRAQNIALELERRDDLLTLRISDDGSGIAKPASDGMGLAIMQYRARLNGGDLTVEPREGGGTRITCTVPSSSTDNGSGA